MKNNRSNMKFHSPLRMGRNLSVLLFCTLVLNACGGGSTPSPPAGGTSTPPGGGTSGGGSGGSGGSGGAASSYLFYTGSLAAVDPASPGLPLVVEPGPDIVTGAFGVGSSARTIEWGTYDPAAKTITGLHGYAVMYAKTDGKLYRVSALKSGSLTPVQVSSESAAHQMCNPDDLDDVMVRVDYANPGDSQFLYALPGVDGICQTGDDEWKMVRLDMSSSDVPVAAKRPVEVVGDMGTGGISGWLVHDAGALQKCKADFTVCNTVTPVASKVNVMLGLGLNRHLMDIDDGLFVYDADTGVLSASIFAIPPATSISASAADDSDLYFAHEKTIYKAAADGSAMATVLAVESEDIGFQMGVTANKVVYTTRSRNVGGALTKAAQVKAVDKVSGPSFLLATDGAADDAFFLINGNNVYYGLTDYKSSGTGPFTLAPIAAGVIDEAGGGKSETANATWMGGAMYPASVDLNKSASLVFPPQKLIRAEGYDAAGSGKGFAGGTLKSFDAVTAAEIATLGVLPSADNLISVSCFGYVDNALCSVLVEVPSASLLPFQSDVFFLNAEIGGSLTRVTNTADKNEIPLFN